MNGITLGGEIIKIDYKSNVKLLNDVKSFDREIVNDGYSYRVIYTLHINEETYIRVPFTLSRELVQDINYWTSNPDYPDGESMAIKALDSMIEGKEKTLYRELRLKQLLNK